MKALTVDPIAGGRMTGLLLLAENYLRMTLPALQPMVPVLARPAWHCRYSKVRPWILNAGILLLVGGGNPGMGGLLTGLTLLSQILVARQFYCTASTLSSFICLHLAFCKNPEDLSGNLRLQYALIYAGAGMNKMRVRDWRNGRATNYFFSRLYNNPLPSTLAAMLRKVGFRKARRLAAKTLAYSVIALELTIAAAYLFPRTPRMAARLALLFHVMTVLNTRGRLAWVFLFHALAQCAYFLPPKALPASPGKSGLHSAFWLGIGLVVVVTQKIFQKKYLGALTSTPALDRFQARRDRVR